MNFDIHGLKIKTDQKYLFPDYFLTEKEINPDLIIDRESYKSFDKSSHEKLGLQFWGGENNVYFESAGFYSNFQKIFISNLFGKKTILSFRSETERHGITTIIKTIFQYKLLQQGKILIHGAALEKDNGVDLFSGWPRTGKSSTVLHLAADNDKFSVLGDDMVILSQDGMVNSFPKKAGVFFKSGHFSSLTKKERFILLIKYLGVKIFPPFHSLFDRSIRVDLDRLVKIKDKSKLRNVYIIRKTKGPKKEEIGDGEACDKVLAHVLNIFYHNPFSKRLFLAYSLLNNENPIYFEEKSKEIIKNALKEKKYFILRESKGNFESCL